MSNETYQEFLKYCDENGFEIVDVKTWNLWNHQQQKLDIEIQSNTKMKEEYRQLKESSEYRIKELEGKVEKRDDIIYEIGQNCEAAEDQNHYFKLMSEYRDKNHTQAERIKELEGEIERQQAFINAECLRCDNNERESKTLTAQLELLTKCLCLPSDIRDNELCFGCKNAALIKGKG